MTITQEIVQRVKEEARSLENGMFTNEHEYVDAMNKLIAYFTEARDNCLANMSSD